MEKKQFNAKFSTVFEAQDSAYPAITLKVPHVVLHILKMS